MPAVSGLDPITGQRTLSSAQEWLLAHLEEQRHPLNAIDVELARQTIEELHSLEPEPWAHAWLGPGIKLAADAERLEADGDIRSARRAWWQSYQFGFLGRYPCPLHPAKTAAYDHARMAFQRATALDDPPVERLVVPFRGRDGEGSEISFHVARPSGHGTGAAVVMWGGVDAWKEESYLRGRFLRENGIATVHVDMPGVGEAPVLAGPDAERMWDPIFDWLDDSEFDSSRIGLLGLSFGGYWAMKLAHTHRDRVRAAVNWGGGIHLTFQESWQERSRGASSYLMDLMAARARIFGGSTFEDYVAACPGLSLLTQGILDRRCSTLLLVNGKDDLQNASADIYLALEYGDPKTARLFPGGHMGDGPVLPTISSWLRQQLVSEAKSS
jgi:pimeloyl-ACP methyl ester carboxylesterase